ncbi:MAG: hypothetical protein AD742_07765 [Methylibium sp. NZG]|nr:MAG: hypothetical protein AD742_07765 [Methylibium sp. NZG]
MNADTAPKRQPLVGEAARPPQRDVLAAGQSVDAAERPGAPVAAPIIALHGVGEFAHGDVIGEIARHPVFSRGGSFRRETVFASDHRFTALVEARAADDATRVTRLLEINWSEVRHAMPNLLGLLRNFVTLLMALNRVGGQGAYGSASLSVPLHTGLASLWLVEAVLVWASLAPALSALLWQLDPGQRMATGALVGLAALYVAALVREISTPLAVGGAAFSVLAVCAGGWTCFVSQGTLSFAAAAAQLHSWATLAGCTAVLLSAIEILLRQRAPGNGDVRTIHRLARIACLWLPLVMLVVLQPLTVSAMLLTMNSGMRSEWGRAFAAGVPFDPLDGQRAASWIALALAGTLVLGALQFRLVQALGRNRAVVMGIVVGLAMLVTARWLESDAFLNCELCQRCVRTDWLGAAGLVLVLGASVTRVLFDEGALPHDPAGATWHPAGSFARFWASVMLAVMPLVLTATLLWLLTRAVQHGGVRSTTDASEIFLQSTKYALLLAPLATKPFARFLDALGDVFFYLVRQRNLHTRKDTLPRLWKALRLLDDGRDGCHVVVFAHSQGTVIAAGMFSRMVRVLLRSRMRLTLVTVGSPVTTLYRNFLGATIGVEFAALCRSQPERFRWFNLYRPADYIGGAVELDGVVNRDLLTPGDHVGYWCDRELLKWLKELSEGRAA